MKEKAINQVVEMMNETFSDLFKEEIFVADIKIKGVGYYYDDSIGKIKAKIGVSSSENSKIFNNKVVKEAFDDFIQILVNEINYEFTNDKDLERWVNDTIFGLENKERDK